MSLTTRDYIQIDSVRANVPDCFVCRTNKIGRGNGEAKFYIGGVATKNWGEFLSNFQTPCFFSRQDLVNYLNMAKQEYDEQSQGYQQDISHLWQKRMDKVSALPENVLFSIYRKVADDPSRFYIQSDDQIWTLFREISLPVMTSLFVHKIQVADGKIYLWFRPFINEIGNVFDNDIVESFVDKEIDKIAADTTIAEPTKLQLVKARRNQGMFRTRILEKYGGRCIITGIDEQSILIASHIKPWAISDNQEKLSKENGLLLTPTYDKLFDKGFISFKDNGEINLSKFFSNDNFKILGLKPKVCYVLKVTEEMKRYLLYHRENVFIK